MKQLIIFIFLLFIVAKSNYAATQTAADCTQSAVETAIAAASNGDTVVVPSCLGGETWTSKVVVAKEITIRGQGTGCPDACVDNTVINDFIFDIQADNVRITGFSFIDTIGTGTGVTLGDSVVDFRVDHNKLDGFESAAIFHELSKKYGVFDHNFITDCGGECFYVKGEGNNVWIADLGAGGYDDGTTFIEDNIFDWVDRGGSNIVDGGAGAKWVFRYNTVNETNFETGNVLSSHGHYYGERDTSHNAGTYSGEVYNNTFNGGAGRSIGKIIRSRGGRLLYFDNSTSGYWAEASQNNAKVTFWNKETTDPQVSEPNCDVAAHDTLGWHDATWLDSCSEDDGSPPSDYPCPAQTNNSYIFNNAAEHIILIDTTGGGSPDPTEYIAEDRDYWDDIGVGDTNFTSDVAASRPGTCTTDDCYWETDTEKLYRCTSTDTWTLVYEPFTYPHPLTLTTSISIQAGFIFGSGIKFGP